MPMARAYTRSVQFSFSRLTAVVVASAVSALAGCGGGGSFAGLELPDLSGKPAGPAVKGLYTVEPDIRVRVQKGQRELEIQGPAQLLVRQAGPTAVRPSLMRAPLRIVCGAGGVTTTDGAGQTRSWGVGNNVEISAGDGVADGVAISQRTPVRIGSTPYPGFVIIAPRWNDTPGAFDVIVQMDVESYLPGVLTHELFKDWPRQAYEAQAVASRTYALHERQRARTENRAFDVEDTDADQVFGGATKSVVANEAVRATRGFVLTDDGRLLRAYYSSTCGGRPASAAFAWPRKPDTEFNLASPLQGKEREHACQRATLYRWTVTRSDDDVTRRMRAWGRQYQHKIATVGRIRSVEVLEVNDAGRANTYRVHDAGGHAYTLTAEELRACANYAAPETKHIKRENRVNSGDVSVSVYADQVVFSGRGWGHGVGMCQWCANGFAGLGWDWRRMLSTFYPGAEIERAYQ